MISSPRPPHPGTLTPCLWERLPPPRGSLSLSGDRFLHIPSQPPTHPTGLLQATLLAVPPPSPPTTLLVLRHGGPCRRYFDTGCLDISEPPKRVLETCPFQDNETPSHLTVPSKRNKTKAAPPRGDRAGHWLSNPWFLGMRWGQCLNSWPGRRAERQGWAAGSQAGTRVWQVWVPAVRSSTASHPCPGRTRLTSGWGGARRDGDLIVPLEPREKSNPVQTEEKAKDDANGKRRQNSCG